MSEPLQREIKEIRNTHSAAGKSLISLHWADLDNLIDKIRDPANADHAELERWKGRAEGIAICLARTSVPYFRTDTDILIRAKQRWEMRQGTREFSPTPGDMQPSDVGYESPGDRLRRFLGGAPSGTTTEPVVKAARKRVAAQTMADKLAKVDDSVKGAIRTGVKAGMPKIKLAAAYGIDIETLEAIAGEGA